MAAKAKLDSGLVCPQCGSNKIKNNTNRIETYCKSCGTVMEDELVRF